MRRVLRLSSRTPSRSSKARTCIVTILGEMLSLRAAAANPPTSTTLTKAVMLVMRSIFQVPTFRTALADALPVIAPGNSNTGDKASGNLW
jgi:hypothetical protein